MRTRDEHLAWAKAEALEHVDRGRLYTAVTTFITALGMHHATKPFIHSPRITLATKYLDAHDADAIRKWIENFQ